jgi:cell division protease FtsH
MTDSRGVPSPQPARPSATPPRPWRTEGLEPERDGEDRRPRGWWRGPFLWALLVYWVVFGVMTVQDRQGDPHPVAYTDFTTQVADHNVADVFARGDTIQGELKESRPVPGDSENTYTTFETVRPAFAQDDLLAQLQDSGAIVRATPVSENRGWLTNLLISFGPILLLVAFYLWLLRRQKSMMGGGLLGRRRKPVDPETVRVTFDDVAGIDEVQAEIAEVVDFLREPDRYRRLGARVPKGVLLAGPPGTGKTLLARATAGEAGVPFFSASSSEFIEMVVGVGASRVRELFTEARKVAPAIIFIDEIDTIGRARGGGASLGGHDEREQTLNQILTEMDGFSGSEGVVVLAATNRPDILDPALIRPGRFDRSIHVSPPDQAGRVAILRVHTRNVPLAADVDLSAVARATPGMTGAELANLVNEAALGAARQGRDQVTSDDVGDALEKIQLGTARDVVLPPEERRRTAYHEAGHALLGMLTPGADPVRKVSIIPRGHALGVTLSTPQEDRYGYDETYLRGRIVGALGGMAAEDVVFGVVTTGAESDLESATGIARAMVGRWGMSERIGPVSVLPRETDPRQAGVSESLLAALDAEVRRIVDECYDIARARLREHRPRLEGIVERLLERETLDEAQVYAAAGLPCPERRAKSAPTDAAVPEQAARSRKGLEHGGG